MSAVLGVVSSYGIRSSAVAQSYGIRPQYGIGVGEDVSALTSTLTSSAASFTAGGAGVTLTFTARNSNNELVVGYTPTVEAGVI